MIGINSSLAPVKINYVAWHTQKNTHRAAAKLRRFGELLDGTGGLAKLGGKAEAVLREYWKEEMPQKQQLCNHHSRETIANWSFEAKTEFLASWAQRPESARLSPLPFMVMSQLGKETGRGNFSQHGTRLQSLVETAIKPIFEAMAKNLFSFAGVKEAA